MQIHRSSKPLLSSLSKARESDPDFSLGFVPTMGAIHEGHLSLLAACRAKTKVVVASIFINPAQFNDASDLAEYPQNEERDLKLLEKGGCDIVYLPNVGDIYPSGTSGYEIDLGRLDEVMEGHFRPNHFTGVAMVVERFFQIVNPDVAFFGQKDFQQLAVIRKMVELRNFRIEIVGVETVRTEDGLALSSRNLLLNPKEKEEALVMYQTLKLGQTLALTEDDLSHIKSKMLSFFEGGNLRLAYLELVDPNSLEQAENVENCQICIAAYCGNIRLIDNMRLRSQRKESPRMF
ncbi:pantoate--beta-alanine ligase [Crocinitomix catalasitica]|nr:pantoate--beta-alanine ligase [Crocinitomix catalasitica]